MVKQLIRFIQCCMYLACLCGFPVRKIIVALHEHCQLRWNRFGKFLLADDRARLDYVGVQVGYLLSTWAPRSDWKKKNNFFVVYTPARVVRFVALFISGYLHAVFWTIATCTVARFCMELFFLPIKKSNQK